jgi:hypothetical protein
MAEPITYIQKLDALSEALQAVSNTLNNAINSEELATGYSFEIGPRPDESSLEHELDTQAAAEAWQHANQAQAQINDQLQRLAALKYTLSANLTDSDTAHKIHDVNAMIADLNAQSSNLANALSALSNGHASALSNIQSALSQITCTTQQVDHLLRNTEAEVDKEKDEEPEEAVLATMGGILASSTFAKTKPVKRLNWLKQSSTNAAFSNLYTQNLGEALGIKTEKELGMMMDPLDFSSLPESAKQSMIEARSAFEQEQQAMRDAIKESFENSTPIVQAYDPRRDISLFGDFAPTQGLSKTAQDRKKEQQPF